MSIQEIAYHLNFSTQSFFGKYFKHKPDSPLANIDQANKFFHTPTEKLLCFLERITYRFYNLSPHVAPVNAGIPDEYDIPSLLYAIGAPVW